MKVKNKLTLVLYPNTHGIGYVLCDSPQEILDFGLKTIRRKEHKLYLAHVKQIVNEAKPDLLFLIDYKEAKIKLSQRIRKIIDQIESYAQTQNISVHKYSRKQIHDVFEEFKATNKYEIAKIICTWYPQLKSRMPHQRMDWTAEHYQMGVFDAFALLLTHYYLA